MTLVGEGNVAEIFDQTLYTTRKKPYAGLSAF